MGGVTPISEMGLKKNPKAGVGLYDNAGEGTD